MPLSISAADLLPLIPLSARTILEVGCGAGELASAYRRMNPKARLLGIEINRDAAALAALHLEQVPLSMLRQSRFRSRCWMASIASFTMGSCAIYAIHGR